MKQAEDKNDMTMVVKGNALKRRSEQALEDTKVLDESIELLKEKRQKMHWYSTILCIQFVATLKYGRNLHAGFFEWCSWNVLVHLVKLFKGSYINITNLAFVRYSGLKNLAFYFL